MLLQDVEASLRTLADLEWDVVGLWLWENDGPNALSNVFVEFVGHFVRKLTVGAKRCQFGKHVVVDAVVVGQDCSSVRLRSGQEPKMILLDEPTG